MNKIIGFLVMVFMFLPWRPIVAIVAAVLFCQHQWYGIVWMASWFGAWIVLPA